MTGGALALIGAQRQPQLVEKLVVIDAVPFFAGYRWHWVAQLWRRRPIGEFLNRTTTKRSLDLLLRQASGSRKPMPSAFVEMIWDRWDEGTQAATLALYRHADPDRLAVAGRDIARLACPSLVVWGEREAYLPRRFAEAYANTLPNAELEIVPGGGHWPWIDDVRVVGTILDFLGR